MKIINVFLIISIIIISSQTSFALKNPAAVYCIELGYEYKIEKKEQAETGYCVFPNGQKAEAWSFLQGTAAVTYNYCDKKGYGQKIIKDHLKCIKFLTDMCLACVLEDGSEVEVTELMGLSFKETTCGDGICGEPENNKTCPRDCPSGSIDDYCDGKADGKCDRDCTAKEDKDCE